MKKHLYIIGVITALLTILVVIPDPLSYALMSAMAKFDMASTINTFILPKLPWIIFWLLITIGAFIKFKPILYLAAISSPYILIQAMTALKLNVNAIDSFAPNLLVIPFIYEALEIIFCFWIIFIMIKFKPWKT